MRCFLLLCFTFVTSALTNAATTQLQIGILLHVPSTTIKPQGSFQLKKPGSEAIGFNWNGPIKLIPLEGGIGFGKMRLPTETRLIPKTGATILVGPHEHVGTLILRLDPGQTVSIIEEIELEKYLEGVLPHEMDSSWPLEALKAQAVVARTFACVNMGKFKSQGFDLTADTLSQVYHGQSDVNDNIRRAVKETHGEVLGWNGHLMPVYYHSCCGGRTENAAIPWGGDRNLTPKPLRGVRDTWCQHSPKMHWSAYFNWQDLMSAFQQRIDLPGPLKALYIGQKDNAGFVESFVARAGNARTVIRANVFRLALGEGDLKSTKIIRLINRDKGVEFLGNGAGHGVGLCQWGARYQADAGRNYEKILQFYFPGSVLSELYP